MKSIALLALLVVAALCLVEGRAAEAEKSIQSEKLLAIPKAPVNIDFNNLKKNNDHIKERLEQFRQALEAFKAKIDASRMNPTHKKAIKEAVTKRMVERFAKVEK